MYVKRRSVQLLAQFYWSSTLFFIEVNIVIILMFHNISRFEVSVLGDNGHFCNVMPMDRIRSIGSIYIDSMYLFLLRVSQWEYMLNVWDDWVFWRCWRILISYLSHHKTNPCLLSCQSYRKVSIRSNLNQMNSHYWNTSCIWYRMQLEVGTCDPDNTLTCHCKSGGQLKRYSWHLLVLLPFKSLLGSNFSLKKLLMPGFLMWRYCH